MKKHILRGITFYLFCLNVFAATEPEASIQSVKKSNDNTPVTTEKEVESPFTGTMTLTSNYLFRGVSQSNNLPAVQGGLTYKFIPWGVYFNVWGSNVYFTDINGQPATLEIDGIVGIANNIGENFSYDISVDRYNYPKASGLNYTEVIAKFTYYFLIGQLGYSSNVYNTSETGTYYNLGFSYDLPEKYFFNLSNFNISGGIGYYSLPSQEFLHSYVDYNLQLNKTIGIYTLSAQWTNTNGQSRQGNLADSKLIASITASF